MPVVFFISLLILLTLASAFFSSSEIALFSLPGHKVQTFQSSSDDRLRGIANLLRHPRDLLVTIFMLNTVSNILLQNVAANLFGDSSGWMLKVGVPFALTLLCGEIIPKYMGLRNNLAIAYAVTPSINALQRALAPIRKITIAIAAPISRLFFFYLHKDKEIVKEEITHALKTAQEQGIIEPTEVEWATGYLNLLEANVKDLMRPKEDVLFYDIHEPLSQLIRLFVSEECSRVPICDGNLDSVLGVMHAVQFFVYREAIEAAEPLEPFLKKVLFIPEVTSAKALLSRFYRQQEVLALAVNEYGSVTGLITLEDIAEVVIGEVVDPRDHQTLYTRAGDDEIIASGKLELEELNALFDAHLTSENMLTIGGWLTEQVETIPRNGFTYEKEGLFFHVLTATPRRIQRVYIRKLKNKPIIIPGE